MFLCSIDIHISYFLAIFTLFQLAFANFSDYSHCLAQKNRPGFTGRFPYCYTSFRQAAASSRRVEQETMEHTDAMVWMLLTYCHLL